ncbi:MAG: hypothetical protein KF678_13500 [Phycisphaeraceae bacterium]|nr:hypothetical protein [Phycisphaeraceae bacterium]
MKRHNLLMHLAAVLFSATCGSAAWAQPECRPYWAATPQPPLGLSPNLVAFDDGNGRAVYAVWSTLRKVRRFDGGSWTDVPNTGITTPGLFIGPLVLHHGNQESLCVMVWGPRTGDLAGGTFNPYDIITYSWTGAGWQLFNSHPNFRKVIPVLSLPWRGSRSIFGFGGTTHTTSICQWENNDWRIIGTTHALNVRLTTFDDGTGEALLAFGDFTQINGVPCQGFAKWDGQNWKAPWPEPVRGVRQLFAEFTDHNGRALFGAFEASINGEFTEGIGRWDGRTFSSIGGPVYPPGHVGGYFDLQVWDDGTGPGLFLAGGFHMVTGNVETHGIAKYQNGAWHAVGGAGVGGAIERMVIMPHARGNSVFVHGVLHTVNGAPVQRFAQLVGCPNCYVDCDLSTGSPKVTANDLLCFLNTFAQRDPYANCTMDASINAADFQCFLNRFAQGCP